MPVHHSAQKVTSSSRTPRVPYAPIGNRKRLVSALLSSKRKRPRLRQLDFDSPSLRRTDMDGSLDTDDAPCATHHPTVVPAINSTQLQNQKSFKPIPFAAYADQPAEWFSILESDFECEGITDEAVKCRIARIGISKHQPTLELIRDCLNLTNCLEPYVTLKSRVIKRLAHSEDTKWSRFQGHHELGSRKPSHFLAELKLMAPSDAPEKLIRNTFLASLPSSLSSQLEIQTQNKDLDELAQMADLILEKYASTYITHGQTMAINNPNVVDQSKIMVSEPTTDALKQMQEQLEVLAVNVRKLSENKQKATKTKTINADSRTTDRKRRPQPGDPDYLCWYHWKYGRDARKCNQPCCYKPVEQKN